MLAIAAPLEQELAGLRAALRRRRASNPERPVLAVAGVGQTRCQENIRRLLANGEQDQAIDGLLVIGFAGGADHTLGVGGLALAPTYYLTYYLRSDTNAEPLPADSGMFTLGLRAASAIDLPVSESASLTVDRLIANSTDKLALGRRYSVSSVNMEDYWVAQTASEYGVPFLSARVVLDPATQDLPSYLPNFARSRKAAVLRAASKPWRFPIMLRIARQMRECQRVLANFALSYLDQWNDQWDQSRNGRATASSTGPAGPAR